LSRTGWALRHVHFEVERNDIVGVLGNNGGGKTTLLKILARISQSTEGYAEVRGSVGALLDGGAGFHAELTGRENVFLLASLLGRKRIEDRRQLDAVVAFAELEESIDTPLKYYSAGFCGRCSFGCGGPARRRGFGRRRCEFSEKKPRKNDLPQRPEPNGTVREPRS